METDNHEQTSVEFESKIRNYSLTNCDCKWSQLYINMSVILPNDMYVCSSIGYVIFLLTLYISVYMSCLCDVFVDAI